MYDDIKKLESVKHHFKSNYFLQSHDVEEEYGLLIHRLRKSDTTLIEDDHQDRDINHGVYIDIYPLFNCYNKGFKRAWMSKLILLCRLFAYNAPPKNKKGIVQSISNIILKTIPQSLKRRVVKWGVSHIQKIKETGYITTAVDLFDSVVYKKDWFRSVCMIDFDGIMLPVPIEYDIILKSIYGDYMKLPPVEKRCVHHNYLFLDLDRPYTDYKGIYYSNKAN